MSIDYKKVLFYSLSALYLILTNAVYCINSDKIRFIDLALINAMLLLIYNVIHAFIFNKTMYLSRGVVRRNGYPVVRVVSLMLHVILACLVMLYAIGYFKFN